MPLNGVLSMRVVINPPTPVGEQNYILLILGGITLTIGIVSIIFGLGSTTSGRIGVSGGCCAGCLLILLSAVLLSIGMNRMDTKSKPGEIQYVED